MLESFFNKVAGLKKRLQPMLQQRCIPVKFGKFLKIPIFAERLPWLRGRDYTKFDLFFRISIINIRSIIMKIAILQCY